MYFVLSTLSLAKGDLLKHALKLHVFGLVYYANAI